MNYFENITTGDVCWITDNDLPSGHLDIGGYFEILLNKVLIHETLDWYTMAFFSVGAEIGVRETIDNLKKLGWEVKHRGYRNSPKIRKSIQRGEMDRIMKLHRIDVSCIGEHCTVIDNKNYLDKLINRHYLYKNQMVFETSFFDYTSIVREIERYDENEEIVEVKIYDYCHTMTESTYLKKWIFGKKGKIDEAYIFDKDGNIIGFSGCRDSVLYHKVPKMDI